MPRANWDILKKYPLALPPDPLLALFNETIRYFVTAIHNWIFRNRNLRRTRDLLLPKLISGEIDVARLAGLEQGDEDLLKEGEALVEATVAPPRQGKLW